MEKTVKELLTLLLENEKFNNERFKQKIENIEDVPVFLEPGICEEDLREYFMQKNGKPVIFEYQFTNMVKRIRNGSTYKTIRIKKQKNNYIPVLC